ncbi:predicted protein [Botrytis cinerea T4]|uniref:Uncharacterized protein n=1 Tax=Botryotinia fuckeliana (strain T4) TaxID=999810 RepID=G2YWV9_BOTF4|nr:predicted protein [Botrytis cinerea T4]
MAVADYEDARVRGRCLYCRFTKASWNTKCNVPVVDYQLGFGSRGLGLRLGWRRSSEVSLWTGEVVHRATEETVECINGSLCLPRLGS